MISYDLAKKLKDAGFLQPKEKTDSKPFESKLTEWENHWAYDEGEELHLVHSDNDTGWTLGNGYQAIPNPEWILCPTLSGIIEACGDRFKLLERETNVIGRDSITDMEIIIPVVWRACGFLIDISVVEKFIHSVGSTPEEAGANLYLALNESKDVYEGASAEDVLAAEGRI